MYEKKRFVDYYGVNLMDVYFFHLDFLPLGMNYFTLHSNPTQCSCSCETKFTSPYYFSSLLLSPELSLNTQAWTIKIFHLLAISPSLIPIL